VSRPGMVAEVIKILLRRFVEPKPRHDAVTATPWVEVNAGDIPTVNQWYVRSLTGTIQINVIRWLLASSIAVAVQIGANSVQRPL